MWIAASKWQFKLCFLEFSGKKIFFQNIFHSLLVESMDAEPTDTKGDWRGLFLYSINGLYISYFVIIPTHSREGEKVWKCLFKGKNGYEREEVKSNLATNLLFLNKSILNKHINFYSIFLFVYYSQLNHTCLSNVFFKWAISL